MTSFDKKLLLTAVSMAFVCLIGAAVVLMAGAAAIGIANYGVTFSSPSWPRSLLISASALIPLFAISLTLGLVVGFAFAREKTWTYWKDQTPEKGDS